MAKRPGRVRTVTSTLGRTLARFPRDPSLRAGLRHYLSKGSWPSGPRSGGGAGGAQSAKAAPAPRPAGDIVRGANVLAGLEIGPAPAHVNLVLHELDPARIYAGVKTAITVGVAAARHRGLPLRLISLNREIGPDADDLLRAWVGEHLPAGQGPDVALSAVDNVSLPGMRPSAEDVWVATFWTTALAVSRACRKGTVKPANVIYLVQDYEPAFHAWSDEYALAASTYRQGFRLLVNSTPLARFLADEAGVDVPEAHVFAPDVDLTAVEQASAAWKPGIGSPRVLFYGRARHPRNLFRIGIESLRIWTEQLPGGQRPTIVSAGDEHPPIDLGTGVIVESRGKLSLGDYYRTLAETDVGLALMHSPHPGHLSLELPAAGIPTVTNGFGSYRSSWQPNLLVAPSSDPYDIAAALHAAWERARVLTTHQYGPPPTGLGRPLGDAVKALLETL